MVGPGSLSMFPLDQDFYKDYRIHNTEKTCLLYGLPTAGRMSRNDYLITYLKQIKTNYEFCLSNLTFLSRQTVHIGTDYSLLLCVQEVVTHSMQYLTTSWIYSTYNQMTFKMIVNF